MTAEISRLPARQETPLQRAKRLNVEAKALSLEVAGMLKRDIAALSERCAEAAGLEPLKPGLQDAFRKLGMELESRMQTIEAIIGKTA